MKIEWAKTILEDRCFADVPADHPPYAECDRVRGHSGEHMERPRLPDAIGPRMVLNAEQSVVDLFARNEGDEAIIREAFAAVRASLDAQARHPFTCAYCRDAGIIGPGSEFPRHALFEDHMAVVHPGLPFEPKVDGP